MAVYRRKGRKTWTYEFLKAGIRFRKGGFKTEERAKDAEAKARVKAHPLNTDLRKLCEMRLQDIKNRLTKGHYRDNKQLFDRLIPLWSFQNEITRADVVIFLNQISNEVSNHRANRYLRYINALFNFGIMNEIMFSNPASTIPSYSVDPSRKYVPPIKDVLKVISICNQDHRNYLMFLIHTAARSIEINHLKWNDIEEGHIILKTKKSKHSNVVSRLIPINKVLQSVIESITHRGEYVFINRKTNKPYLFRSKFLKRLCREAKVKPFMFHSLRHLSASLMADAGVPITEIQIILGHQRVTTTDIYIKSITGVTTDATKHLEGIN